MSWNGSGTFNRLYSWIADRAAGLDISSVRMDADTNDITAQGFGNCLTRDGQGGPTTNLSMATFKHTNVGNGSARTDYAALGQVQDGLLDWTIDSGSATAYVATYTPALTLLNDGQLCSFRAANSNTTTTPTFAPNGLTPRTITKVGGVALGIGDIQASQEVDLRYNSGSTRWELQNPSNVAALQGAATTGDVKPTYKTSADTGWLMMSDGTMGSATSGADSSTVNNQALFTSLFNNTSDTACPLLTSTGAATTRAAQGTAAAAWAANCRMTLPKMLGRALCSAGAGGGLTSRALGGIVGEENHLLTTSEIPAVAFSGTTGNDSPDHTHGGVLVSTNGYNSPGGATAVVQSANGGSTAGASTRHQHPFSGNISGGGGTHNNMQPSTFVNFMIKQ
ncbi:phage tail protein [Bradyrhizobium canariense]|uniref:Microcystin-dependent protein n=1 Tax=Bradyrhizobium canariense TaxID=255045 RepID=A0A1X3HAD6_9BRAD|nr:hypothetical protein [Bradyrhizobium canariense]OSI68883.1 hypothetical protein BSZ22_19855 [Bradyrhizobium canariense]OSI79405.1 hypothetical protein BSZ23_15085 [Bradyrhizobium canariense]OSI89597.1 hypothetical protein BSZ25_20315 [Bradyrhizobium canariense]OSI91025.1 hypothetical protein BSZ24_18890 [Bradyrhizobium canariense]OSJ03963.1 hypothetical protein BSZ16_14750 [Bradyrhizobium canariense]